MVDVVAAAVVVAAGLLCHGWAAATSIPGSCMAAVATVAAILTTAAVAIYPTMDAACHGGVAVAGAAVAAAAVAGAVVDVAAAADVTEGTEVAARMAVVARLSSRLTDEAVYKQL